MAVRPPPPLVATLRHLWRAFGAPPHEVIADFVTFRRLIGTSREDFYKYRLWDRSRPMAERLRYLSSGDRLAMEHRWNPLPEQLVLRNKAVVSQLLAEADVPAPEVLAVVATDGEVPTAHRVLRSQAELETLLSEPLPSGIVCKPVFGEEGGDVLVFRAASASGLTHFDGSTWPVTRLWERLITPGWQARDKGLCTHWLIQRREVPHPLLTALHGDTLSTVRFVTMRFDNGEIGFLAPSWKVPVGRSGVDNAGLLQHYSSVDLATGRIESFMRVDTLEPLARHPETGKPLVGEQFPFWDEAKRVSALAMAPFPGLRCLGLDVGFTAAGPTVVEVNPWWGLFFMQTPHGRGLVEGEFLRFLEELGAEDVIRRQVRRL